MALVAHLMEEKNNFGPHLIVVPNAVLVNWKAELNVWLPGVAPRTVSACLLPSSLPLPRSPAGSHAPPPPCFSFTPSSVARQGGAAVTRGGMQTASASTMPAP